MSNLDDPRVFFAAERTLLAWNRTSLTLMAFGFMIERFGLFVHLVTAAPSDALERGVSYWIGITFIALGSLVAIVAVIEYRKVLRTLKPIEIPRGYAVNLGTVANLVVALLGVVLTVYLLREIAAPL